MINYFEEEERYMSEMTDAQIEDEYNRLAAVQAMMEAELEAEKERQNECKQEQNSG
jgi:hypothetical protein